MTLETPALIVDKKTSVVGSLGTGKLPAHKRRNENLAVLGKIVGSNSNIWSQGGIVSSQAERIGFLIKNFEALVAIARAATEVDDLVADLAGAFHNKGISIRLLDFGNGVSRASLDFDHLSSVVVLGMGNPVVGEGTSLLEQLAVLLCRFDSLDIRYNVGIIMGLNRTMLLHGCLGCSNLRFGLGVLNSLRLFVRRFLLTISLDGLGRAADGDAAELS